MVNLDLEQYILDVTFLKDVNNNLNKKKDNNEIEDEINNIIDFIQCRGIDYAEFESLLYLSDLIVDIVEKINSNKNINIENTKLDLIKLMDLFINDITSSISINVYFLGKDNEGLINETFLKCDNIFMFSKGVDVCSVIEDSNKKAFKVLIVENIVEFSSVNIKFDSVLSYYGIVNEFKNICQNLYSAYYDYNFLRNELKASKLEDVKNIIVGNSYSLVGVSKNNLSIKTTNLSMSSQDLYYSYKLAKEVISNNTNITRCIIGTGYYIAYHDLSRGESIYSKKMLSYTYKPLLNDIHNAKQLDLKEMFTLNDCLNNKLLGLIFDLYKVEEYISALIYKQYPEYFNEGKLRKNISSDDIDFVEIPFEVKCSMGKERATQHNRLKRYRETYIEFNQILKDFVEYLNKNNVEAIFLIFPCTKYYEKEIDTDYEKDFCNALNKLKNLYQYKIIDLSKDTDFDDSDFIDIDHLNEKGCYKLTAKLDKLINEK